MDSVVIDTIELKESYTTANGQNKTRTHTLRAMSNNGSMFLNYRCGKNSTNINKNMLAKITESINKLTWENKTTNNTNTDTDTTQLLKHIQQLQKQINSLKGK